MKNNDNLSIFQMWHLPSALTASSAVSGANTTATTGGPLNLGSTESHQITSNSVSPATTENTMNNQQTSVIISFYRSVITSFDHQHHYKLFHSLNPKIKGAPEIC